MPFNSNEMIFVWQLMKCFFAFRLFSIDLRKEVADGVRIYFDFLLKGYLLYQQEQAQAAELLSPEALRNFTYIGTEVQ